MYTVNCDNNPNDCVSIKTLLSDEHGGAYNLLTVYAYGIFNIEKIKKLEADPLKKTIHSVVDIVKKL